jgi:catechol 2,3-dioxygenase-like lactoylglutathione lyase family enzyme
MTALSSISIVATDPDASIAFYRLLGVDFEDHSGGAGGIVHMTVRGDRPVDVDIDNQQLAEMYDASARTRHGGAVIIGFSVASRDDVDRIHAAVVAAGHESRQVPYDAFWGARYAIVADPDGNSVGIMSPPDDTMRSWPPTDSPSS